MSVFADLFPESVAVRTVTCVTGAEASLSPLLPGESGHGASASAQRPLAEKRRREFRAGRHVAREALAALQRPIVAIERDSAGVPCFPSGVSGAISHTGRQEVFAIAAATTSNLALGVDAEEERVLSEAVARRVMLESERDLTLAIDGEMELLPLMVFSAKEAVYKSVYPRMRRVLGFHQVRLRAGDDGQLLADVEEHALRSISIRIVRSAGRLVTSAVWRPPLAG